MSSTRSSQSCDGPGATLSGQPPDRLYVARRGLYAGGGIVGPKARSAMASAFLQALPRDVETGVTEVQVLEAVGMDHLVAEGLGVALEGVTVSRRQPSGRSGRGACRP